MAAKPTPPIARRKRQQPLVFDTVPSTYVDKDSNFAWLV